MGRKGANKSRSSAFTHANTQGIGEVMHREFNDIQAVIIPQDTNAGLYTVRLSADANGFGWTVSTGTNLVSSYPTTSASNRQEFYGEQNALFAYWANLFAQYRVDSISVEFEPIGSGSTFSCSPVFSVVDESDTLNGIDPVGNLISKFSSYASVQQHSQYKTCKRGFNYTSGWLGQSEDTAWLQTQRPGSIQTIRELYKTNLQDPSVPSDAPTKRIPGLAFVYGVNSVSTVGGLIGVLRIRTRYRFRQRNVMPVLPFLKPPSPVEEQKQEEDSTTTLSRSEMAEQVCGLLDTLQKAPVKR